jgi:outer membrane receptor protein involved in Fe transport
MRAYLAVLVELVLAVAVLGGARQFSVRGVVYDQRGAPVAGAQVKLQAGDFVSVRITDNDGRFAFEGVPLARGTVVVRARGFETAERSWSAAEGLNLSIVLVLEPLAEQITVTAARTELPLGDVASSVWIVSGSQMKSIGALALDDLLRLVPGFSLFRRSGSRVANPTSQGVSLRGVGLSGASRATVLWDGVPANDPFGGWVYWGRFPRVSIERIEVLRGGSSDLYGTDALGGAVNLISREADKLQLSLESSYGNQRTPHFSLWSGWRGRGARAGLAAELFRTDGYVIAHERARGLVDVPAGSERYAVDLKLDFGSFFLRGELFGEARKNGTRLQRNRTHIRQVILGGELGGLALKLYGGDQVFDQDFSAVSADRNFEALTRSQRVPAGQIGASVQYRSLAVSGHTLVFGFDGRRVYGASDELVFSSGRLSSAVGSGGRQRSLGLFGQDIIRLSSELSFQVGVRFDRWLNYRALSVVRPHGPAPGTAAVTQFADRSEAALSPKLSLLYKPSDGISLMVSAYRAFRAPTLNELYRSFRVGNVLTLANDGLRAERLTGGEAGAAVSARRLRLRGVFFWGEVVNPIANVTLGVSPELITRQRQNLGRTRSRGIEFDYLARVSRSISISGGYQLVDAVVLKFPANRSLEGLRIPQVPRHQLTVQLVYSDPRVLGFGLQGRAASEQFEDDRNQLSLERFFVLDGILSREFTDGVELFIAGENLTGRRYSVGRTPVRSVGPPPLIRAGVRLSFGAR